MEVEKAPAENESLSTEEVQTEWNAEGLTDEEIDDKIHELLARRQMLMEKLQTLMLQEQLKDLGTLEGKTKEAIDKEKETNQEEAESSEPKNSNDSPNKKRSSISKPFTKMIKGLTWSGKKKDRSHDNKENDGDSPSLVRSMAKGLSSILRSKLRSRGVPQGPSLTVDLGLKQEFEEQRRKKASEQNDGDERDPEQAEIRAELEELEELATLQQAMNETSKEPEAESVNKELEELNALTAGLTTPPPPKPLQDSKSQIDFQGAIASDLRNMLSQLNAASPTTPTPQPLAPAPAVSKSENLPTSHMPAVQPPAIQPQTIPAPAPAPKVEKAPEGGDKMQQELQDMLAQLNALG